MTSRMAPYGGKRKHAIFEKKAQFGINAQRAKRGRGGLFYLTSGPAYRGNLAHM